MTQTLNLSPARPSGLDPIYPAPPRVHWIVLLLTWWAITWLITAFAPLAYQELFNSLVADAWTFYLCRWIHSLDPEAKSPLWCDIYLVVELGFAALGAWPNPPQIVLALMVGLGIVSLVLAIATIWLIKADLEKHYNQREPIGLVLSGLMTFFFSFLYFQFHLYRIAKQKHEQTIAGLGPSHTPSA